MRKNSQQAWLCILSKENFEVLKKERVYGVPGNIRARNGLKKVSVGDILLFYAISPVQSILGFSKATSSMFEEKKRAPWADRHYPYRVRISEVEETRIPLRKFVGKISSIKKRIPMGLSLIPISQYDLEIIRSSARI